MIYIKQSMTPWFYFLCLKGMNLITQQQQQQDVYKSSKFYIQNNYGNPMNDPRLRIDCKNSED